MWLCSIERTPLPTAVIRETLASLGAAPVGRRPDTQCSKCNFFGHDVRSKACPVFLLQGAIATYADLRPLGGLINQLSIVASWYECLPTVYSVYGKDTQLIRGVLKEAEALLQRSGETAKEKPSFQPPNRPEAKTWTILVETSRMPTDLFGQLAPFFQDAGVSYAVGLNHQAISPGLVASMVKYRVSEP